MIVDLVALVADKNMEHALRGILSRHQAIGIRPIEFEIYVYPDRDAGCYNQGATFLHSISHTFRHAILLLDRDGSGREHRSRDQIENQIEEQLCFRKLDERTRVVVIEPELENWLWSASPHVSAALGWDSPATLRNWLETQGLWGSTAAKPKSPKEAVEAAMRQSRKPRSSAVYLTIAQKVSLSNCEDPAFGKLLTTLRAWFPPA